MNTLRLPKPSNKKIFIALLIFVVLGIPLALYQSQIQQTLRQLAWNTRQSAASACSPDTGNAVIQVGFSNVEDTKDINVVAKDIQTGKSIDLGTVKHGQTTTGTINTAQTSLQSGAVLFSLAYTDNSSSDSFSASYDAVPLCPAGSATPTPPLCTDQPKNQGFCRWDRIQGAGGYTVTITATDSGKVIQKVDLPPTASESAFTMDPETGYQCSVVVTNRCGIGVPALSPPKVCPAPPPVPTGPFCPAKPDTTQACVWDALDGTTAYNVIVTDVDTGKTVTSQTVQSPIYRLEYQITPGDTYQCSVTPVNECGGIGTTVQSPPKYCALPTPTPVATATPAISEIPTPTISAIPTVTLTPSPTAIPTLTPSPTLTPTPLPTWTPTPTPTRAPSWTPTPTPRKIVQPPPPVINRQAPPPPNIVRTVTPTPIPPRQIVPTQPIQPTTIFKTTPQPTLVPTGDINTTSIIGGVALIITMVGAIVFFAL